MSDLAKTFVRAKYNTTPRILPIMEGKSAEEGNQKDEIGGDEEMDKHDDASSSTSSVSTIETVRPSWDTNSQTNTMAWSEFFSQELYLETQNEKGRAKFHVYISPPPKLDSPLIVFHHGAGSSGMSFAILSIQIKMIYPEAGILALDARAHGSTVWDISGRVEEDMSLESLSHDLVQMIMLTKERLNWALMPRLFLVGHSLGGAVVTEVAKQGLLGNKVIAYAVIDVVEGSAIEALTHMQSYLSTRPPSFDSVDDAVEWHIRSRTIRNADSAKASVPALLVSQAPDHWKWRTDLSKTQPYWRDWFSGLSSKFLTARGAKLLILAGTDRLDKELMIGQMQGKFQMQILPTAGHFVHEDAPEKTAELVVEFVRRNDQSTLVLPPKVSELLNQGKPV